MAFICCIRFVAQGSSMATRPNSMGLLRYDRGSHVVGDRFNKIGGVVFDIGLILIRNLILRS